jgi:hypothetical protein
MNLVKRYDDLIDYYKNRQIKYNWNCEYQIQGMYRHHINPKTKYENDMVIWSNEVCVAVYYKEHVHLHWLLWKANPIDNGLNASYVRTKFGNLLPQHMPKDSEEFKVWEIANSKHYYDMRIPVVCLETRKRYKSIAEAQEETGSSNIHNVLAGNHLTSLGYHWVTEDWFNKASEMDIRNKLKCGILRSNRDSNSKSVLCIETDTLYRTTSDASEMLGISSQSIRRVCRDIQNIAGGFTWKYVDLTHEQFYTIFNDESSTTIQKWSTQQVNGCGSAKHPTGRVMI